MTSFPHIWEHPLVVPTTEGPGAGIHGEDSQLSMRCPVYRGANARSLYLTSSGGLRFSWRGGDDYDTWIPDWAMTQYNTQRRRWEDLARKNGIDDPSAARYSMDSPFGGREGGGHMLHGGGLVLILFTGLAVKVPEGYQLMVGPATNFRPNPGWAVQSGCYPHGYGGEVSLNIHVLVAGSYVVPDGMPFASAWLVPENPPSVAEPHPCSVDAFYLKKAVRLARA